MVHTASRVLLALWIASGPASTYEPTLDSRAIGEAIAIGQSRIARARVAFHEPYRIRVAQPPVDYVEVVTPFRRVALAAEERAQAGGRSFGQRDALAAIAAARDELDVVVEMTFHPLNTYVGVPPYEVVLEDPATGDTSASRRLELIPRFGPRVNGLPAPSPFPGPGLPDGSQPLLGGTVIASFGGGLLDPTGTYDVVIGEAGMELARARMNLARVR